MKQILSVFFISFFFVACQKGPTEDVPLLADQTIKDVAYGSDPAQKMDVYLPANRNATDTKVFIMVHGGAWNTGDKTELDEYIPVFKQRLPGYAIFNINYRLAIPPSNPFPTQENDVRSAFNFIVAKGGEYKFNPEKLAVLGVSAGAHLGLLQTYKNATPKVKAIVDMFGPTSLTDLYNTSSVFLQLNIKALMGNSTPSTNPQLYESSSPINFVTAQSPPTLILHGLVDPLVPLAQSTMLQTKLQTVGATVQIVTYPAEGHGWTGASLLDTYDKITAFLTTYNQ